MDGALDRSRCDRQSPPLWRRIATLLGTLGTQGAVAPRGVCRREVPAPVPWAAGGGPAPPGWDRQARRAAGSERPVPGLDRRRRSFTSTAHSCCGTGCALGDTGYPRSLDVNAEVVRQGRAWIYRQHGRCRRSKRRFRRNGPWPLPEAERAPPWVWRRHLAHDAAGYERRRKSAASMRVSWSSAGPGGLGGAA
jgi:hypothetical protein